MISLRSTSSPSSSTLLRINKRPSERYILSYLLLLTLVNKTAVIGKSEENNMSLIVKAKHYSTFQLGVAEQSAIALLGTITKINQAIWTEMVNKNNVLTYAMIN